MAQTFSKDERLCSLIEINDLVKNGAGMFHYPFKIVYKAIEEAHDGCCAEERKNRILISVPKKNFKRAVKRNLLKRRIRESYRKNKYLLDIPTDIKINFMLVYISKDILEYGYIEQKIKNILEKISDVYKQSRTDCKTDC